MENGCNMYRQRYTSDSCNTDRERCTDIITTAGPHISGDTVGNDGGSSSGSGWYFTSPSHLDWTSSPYSLVYAPTANASGFHELLLPSRLSSPACSSAQPDPHLTHLQLGKRHCFEFGEGISASSAFSDGDSRRGRRVYCSGGAMGVVRCQVDGCEALLGRAKEYHRRHRVCEVHAKAPVVVVVGRHQRFCQQCSRFHAVSEFDESKRSCRRRLAGHNERRRKSSHDNVPRARTSYQGGALSLLSSRTDACGSDLSLRCSAALRELIAEHRATILAHQLVLERNGLESDPINSHSLASKCMHQEGLPSLPTCGRADEVGSQVTLDLMRGTSSAFGLLSMRTKQQQEGCEMWNSSEGV